MNTPGFKFLNQKAINRMKTINLKKYEYLSYSEAESVGEYKIIELIYDYLAYHLANTTKVLYKNSSNRYVKSVQEIQNSPYSEESKKKKITNLDDELELYSNLLNAIKLANYSQGEIPNFEVLYLMYIINAILSNKEPKSLSKSDIYQYILTNLNAYQPTVAEPYTRNKKALSLVTLKIYAKKLFDILHIESTKTI